MRIIGILLCAALFIAAIIGIAGTPAWWNAWVFFAFMAVLVLLTSRLINSRPGLAEERRTASARAKPWDLPLVRLINLALPAMLVTGALDVRFRWLPAVPDGICAAAFAAMIFTAAVT